MAKNYAVAGLALFFQSIEISIVFKSVKYSFLSILRIVLKRSMQVSGQAVWLGLSIAVQVPAIVHIQISRDTDIKMQLLVPDTCRRLRYVFSFTWSKNAWNGRLKQNEMFLAGSSDQYSKHRPQYSNHSAARPICHIVGRKT